MGEVNELKPLCRSYISTELGLLERKFVMDSILFSKHVVGPVSAFPIFRLHSLLAPETCEVLTSREASSVVQWLDDCFGKALDFYSSRFYSNSDEIAALNIVAPMYNVIKTLVGKDDALSVYEGMRQFYADTSVPYHEQPFAYGQVLSLLVDNSSKEAYANFMEHYSAFEFKNNEILGTVVVIGLCYARLYADYGYEFALSLPSTERTEWYNAFAWLMTTLRTQGLDLGRRVREAAAGDKILATLFGQNYDSLAKLVGFEPLNPLALVQHLPDPIVDIDAAVAERKGVDYKLLKIRGSSAVMKIRDLVQKIQTNCLQGDARSVSDESEALRRMNPTQAIDEVVVDNLREFSSVAFLERVEDTLSKQLRKEQGRKEDIVWLGRYVGDIGLVISGVSLAASYLGLTQSLTAALSGARNALFPIAATARILSAGMRVVPGFDIFTAFQEWAKSI